MKKVYDPLIDRNVRSLDGYTHIRAYHGCRPISVDSYLEQGIRTMTKDELLEEAKKRLRTLRKSVEDIQSAFEKAWDEYHYEGSPNEGVYLSAWKEDLLSCASHYLIYGSELINATAVKLASDEWESNEFRDELKKSGIPTLLICDVPIKDINPWYLRGIEDTLPIQNNTAILVPYVEADNIIKVEHPKELKDVFYGNATDRYHG